MGVVRGQTDAGVHFITEAKWDEDFQGLLSYCLTDVIGGLNTRENHPLGFVVSLWFIPGRVVDLQ